MNGERPPGAWAGWATWWSRRAKLAGTIGLLGLLLEVAARPWGLREAWVFVGLAAPGVAAVGLRGRGTRRVQDGVTLLLGALALVATMRYLVWRGVAVFVGTEHAGRGPWRDWASAGMAVLLLLAEAVAAMAAAWRWTRRAWPLRRQPVPLPEDVAAWPHVDVVLDTLGKPGDEVETALALCRALDWPSDRLHLLAVDRAERAAVRRLCEACGVRYEVRDGGAVGGGSPFVACFTVERLPVRSFLQLTMGWLLREPALAYLQTAMPVKPATGAPGAALDGQGRGWSQDPGRDQDGADLRDRVVLEASGAVLRRAAFAAAGGLPGPGGEAFASAGRRVRREGWTGAYLGIGQVVWVGEEGAASERLVASRAELLVASRAELLLSRGRELSGWIFLAVPAVSLFAGLRPLPGAVVALLTLALPRFACARLAWAWRGDSSGSEVPPTAGTPWAWAGLLVGNGVALAGWVLRMSVAGGPWASRSGWGETAVLAGWAGWNLGCLLWVRWGERAGVPRRRGRPRQPVRERVRVRTPGGVVCEAEVQDLSEGGACLRAERVPELAAGKVVRLEFAASAGLPGLLGAEVLEQQGDRLRLRFLSLTPAQRRALAVLLYAPADRALTLVCGVRPLWLQATGGQAAGGQKAGLRMAAIWVVLLGLGGGLLAAGERHLVRGVPAPETARHEAGRPATPRWESLPLVHQEERTDTVLRAQRPALSLTFQVPSTRLAVAAALKVRFVAGARAWTRESRLEVALNDSVVRSFALQGAASHGTGEAYVVNLPTELVVPESRLRFRLIGPEVTACQTRRCPTMWVILEPPPALLLQTLPVRPASRIEARRGAEERRRDGWGRSVELLGSRPGLLLGLLLGLACCLAWVGAGLLEQQARRRLGGAEAGSS